MFVEEARWINRAIGSCDTGSLHSVLDVGSSTREFRTVVQPHIDEFVHRPILSRGGQITFADLKAGDGVDVVVDLSDPDLPDRLFEQKYGLIICCNILEHVENREIFLGNLVRFCAPGSFVIITVPRRYPRHNDPIETMYRPSVSQLTEFISQFVQSRVIIGETISINDRNYYSAKAGRLLTRLTMLPLRRRIRWYVKPLRWQVTCLLIQVQK